MERIKTALDRARLERQGTPFTRDALRSRETGPTGEIKYTTTRTQPMAGHLFGERRLLHDKSPAYYTDAYKILRTQTLLRLSENGWNTLAVTSAGCGEGRTSVALNLAFSLSLEVDHTVLLVEADLRAPRMVPLLGLAQGKGLAHVLAGEAELSECLIHPQGTDRMVLLPAGRAETGSAELLSAPTMARLVAELKSRYPERIVVFDVPPLLGSSDALGFLPLIDAVLLVVEDGKSQVDDVTRALQLLHGSNFLGTALNKVPDYALDRGRRRA